MAHDLIIRGGDVLDGTGAAAVRADVAVDGDRIGAVGDLTGETATNEIDAQSLASSKAFEQLGWRPQVALDDGLRASIEWYRTHLERSRVEVSA